MDEGGEEADEDAGDDDDDERAASILVVVVSVIGTDVTGGVAMTACEDVGDVEEEDGGETDADGDDVGEEVVEVTGTASNVLVCGGVPGWYVTSTDGELVFGLLASRDVAASTLPIRSRIMIGALLCWFVV